MTEAPDEQDRSRLGRRDFLRLGAGAVAGGSALLAGGGRSALPGSRVGGLGRRPTQSGTQITFWNPSGDALGDPITKKMVTSYNAGQGKKDGIYVNQDSVSTADNSIKFTTAMATGSAPDLVQTYSYNIVVSWAASGFLQPVDQYFHELGWSEDQFWPFVWQMMHVNGHIWGLLQEWDADLLYWNKKIHTGAPPTTIDEIDKLSAEYTKFDKAGNLVQAGLIPWEQGGFTTGGYGDWGLIFGAEFYDESSGTWTITKPQNQRFLNWYLKYVDMLGGRAKADALVSATPSTYGPGDIFNYGKSAFSMEGEWFPKELIATAGKAAYQLDYGIQPALITKPGINSGKQCMIVGANLFVIPKRSHDPAAAARFMKYMVETPQLIAWSIPIGQGMPTKAASQSPQLLAALPFMSHWDSAAKNGYFQAEPTSPMFPVFDTAMGVAIENVTQKKQSPSQALSYVDNQVSQALQRFKESNPTWPSE
jgi:ABC-type glycerol-3-phosphate transport system substrate-binding protein